MGFDHRVTSDLVDLPALRAFLVAHAVPGLDDVEVLADGSTRHRRLVAVDGDRRCPLTVTLPPGDVGVAGGHAPRARRMPSPRPPPSAAAGSVSTPTRRRASPRSPTTRCSARSCSARPHLRVPGSTDAVRDRRARGARPARVPGRRAGLRRPPRRRPRPPISVWTAGVSRHPRCSRRSTRGTSSAPSASPAPGPAPSWPSPARSPTARLDDSPSQVGYALTPRSARPGSRSAGAPGVGPWTADLVALRALRDPDVFLPGDLVLRKALGGVTADRRPRRWPRPGGRTARSRCSTCGPTTPSTRRADRRPQRPGGTASRRSRREHRQWCGAPLPRRGDRPAHPEAG